MASHNVCSVIVLVITIDQVVIFLNKVHYVMVKLVLHIILSLFLSYTQTHTVHTHCITITILKLLTQQ